MSIWQKISDKASTFGGSVLAALSGKTVEGETDPGASVSFTIAVVALGAKMAKADGIVTEEEIEAFKEVFKVAPEEMGNVARVFNMAKKDVAGYEAYAQQVAELFAGRPQVLEDVLDSLFHIAKADDVMHEAELAFLRDVASIFGLAEKFRCIKARHVQSGDDDPYTVLGVDPCASDVEVRVFYRALVKENHPDRHIAAGLPPEMIKVANERLASINSAYEAIAKERQL